MNDKDLILRDHLKKFATFKIPLFFTFQLIESFLSYFE